MRLMIIRNMSRVYLKGFWRVYDEFLMLAVIPIVRDRVEVENRASRFKILVL